MSRKICELPDPPQGLPTGLPFEDLVSQGINKVLSIAEKDPVLNKINGLIRRIPIIPEKRYATPFGTYKTPEFYIPELTPAVFDERRREAVKAAIIDDLSGLIEKIPGIGAAAGIISDVIEDNAMAKIQETLTPEELEKFRSYDKVDPLTTVAVIRTMIRTQKEL